MTDSDSETVNLASLRQRYMAVRADLTSLEQRVHRYQRRLGTAGQRLPHEQFEAARKSSAFLHEALGDYRTVLARAAAVLESIRYPVQSEETRVHRDEEGRIQSTTKLLEALPETEPLPPEFFATGVEVREALDTLNRHVLNRLIELDAALPA